MKKTEPWTLDMLVPPWNLDLFKGDEFHKQTVIDRLNERKFPMKRLLATPPNTRVQKAVGTLMLQILNTRDLTEDLPWMLLMSKSKVLLQALAVFMPVVFSLTTTSSCAMTNITNLMDTFQERRNSYDLDITEQLITGIRMAGFLSWESINDVVVGSSKQSGRFSAILEHRMRGRKPTLFTASYGMDSANVHDKILKIVGKNLGSSMESMITSIPVVINLKTDIQAAEIRQMTV